MDEEINRNNLANGVRHHLPHSSYKDLPRHTNSAHHSGNSIVQSQRPARGSQAHSYQTLKSMAVPSILDDTAFHEAAKQAIAVGVPLDVMLIRLGLINEQDYLQQLSRQLDLPVIGRSDASRLLLRYEQKAILTEGGLKPYVVLTDDGVALMPAGLSDEQIASEVEALTLGGEAGGQCGAMGRRVSLVTDDLVRREFESRFRDGLLAEAENKLAARAPCLSAKYGLSYMQMLGLVLLIALTVAGFNFKPEMTALWLSSFFALFFFLLISLRAMAVISLARLSLPLGAFRNRRSDEGAGPLPIYTLLVPLYKEANMIPQLVKSLTKLDYPAALTDIKLLLEERDQETIAAVHSLALPACFEVLIVPDGLPLTKPKALNYGLHFTRGAYVVIYDAEDMPEPGQLRAALAKFKAARISRNRAPLAVVQARLNFYNSRQNWFARQFTIEYSSLFDGLLPLFSYLGIPIPLGGTSNHFCRATLDKLGGWDPYNVTEDADLGMRLYRCGYRAAILDSTTYEEACCGFTDWLKQRTRWMKGWLQTYCVHMRRPLQLYKELGLWRFFGFQAVIGAPFFSALVHPIFMVLLIYAIIDLPLERIRAEMALALLWGLALFNLATGYLASMLLGVVSLRYRNIVGLFFSLVTLPLYWLLVSLAAYRAVFQFIFAPFKWEKTPHKGR